MKEATWEDCLESESAVKVTGDKAKSNSLTKTAEGRIRYLKEIKTKEENINYIFESYYASILELIHAFAVLQGYQIKNHICVGFYLKYNLKRGDLFRIFDDLRFKRNSLTYYGKAMDFEVAKKAIRDSLTLIRKLQELLK